jgi:putative transposase
MARLPRLTLPGYPHHIIQRGNNRQMIFADTQDFATMMALLAENAHKFAVAVHAYVLMDNHFHLLATPATAEALPLMMQAVGRSYVRYFNQRHARSGTLWEGRYRSTLIETERYLLACMVYIDLNPVRAGMVAQPGAWQWSSHAHYLGQRIDKLVTPHAPKNIGVRHDHGCRDPASATTRFVFIGQRTRRLRRGFVAHIKGRSATTS